MIIPLQIFWIQPDYSENSGVFTLHFLQTNLLIHYFWKDSQIINQTEVKCVRYYYSLFSWFFRSFIHKTKLSLLARNYNSGIYLAQKCAKVFPVTVYQPLLQRRMAIWLQPLTSGCLRAAIWNGTITSISLSAEVLTTETRGQKCKRWLIIRRDNRLPILPWL